MTLRKLTSLLFGIAVFLALLVFAAYGYRARVRSVPEGGASAPSVHFYKDKNRSLQEIRVKLFYAVPRNRADQIYAEWRATVDPALERFAKFHALQFRGGSRVTFDVFPDPVVLLNDNLFYDTEATDRGNPRALIAVAQEIEARVFKSSGDLYKSEFASFGGSEYPVMGLIYEGVGAAGGIIGESELESAGEIAAELGIPESYVFVVDVESVDGFFILNRKFLADAETRENGATLLYHEFTHTLGVADAYDLETNAAFSEDIMGSGRRKPLEYTYLDRAVLSEMGVIVPSK